MRFKLPSLIPKFFSSHISIHLQMTVNGQLCLLGDKIERVPEKVLNSNEIFF
jgi:hypothetical protein